MHGKITRDVCTGFGAINLVNRINQRANTLLTKIALTALAFTLIVSATAVTAYFWVHFQSIDSSVMTKFSLYLMAGFSALGAAFTVYLTINVVRYFSTLKFLYNIEKN